MVIATSHPISDIRVLGIWLLLSHPGYPVEFRRVTPHIFISNIQCTHTHITSTIRSVISPSKCVALYIVLFMPDWPRVLYWVHYIPYLHSPVDSRLSYTLLQSVMSSHSTYHWALPSVQCRDRPVYLSTCIHCVTLSHTPVKFPYCQTHYTDYYAITKDIPLEPCHLLSVGTPMYIVICIRPTYWGSFSSASDLFILHCTIPSVSVPEPCVNYITVTVFVFHSPSRFGTLSSSE